MDLRGWDYTGRNIGPEFHAQYYQFCDFLGRPQFVNHQTWGNPLQDKLAKAMQISSSGVIRTIKRMFVNFGFIDPQVINNHTELYGQDFLTKRGKILLQTVKLERELQESSEYKDTTKEKALEQIKNLYEEIYCEALSHYYIKNPDGTSFSPLRATLQSINRYGNMDKWEWYLMNTFIHHDDDAKERETLDKYISLYRSGRITFSMNNVVEKPKGHQYTPQHYDYAGLVHLIQRPDWKICKSNNHNDVKAHVLSNNFLTELYGGI